MVMLYFKYAITEATPFDAILKLDFEWFVFGVFNYGGQGNSLSNTLLRRYPALTISHTFRTKSHKVSRP